MSSYALIIWIFVMMLFPIIWGRTQKEKIVGALACLFFPLIGWMGFIIYYLSTDNKASISNH